ncbi:MAG TPA: ABC transporter substrate-binding protein [Dehalococcoidia bacterium]|nr:ABC transporter substrate-binding protein [Dehalococcoidia bacterium]
MLSDERGYWDKFWNRRLSRRSVLAGAAVSSAGLAAAALVGCSSDSTPSSSSGQTSGQPRPGGVLKRATTTTSGFTNGLDAQALSPISVGYMLMFYEGLLSANSKTFQPEAALAEKWEIPEGNQFIFTIRQNVHFHNKAPVNGRLLTAEDVLLSLQRILAGGPNLYSKSLFTNVDKIEQVSPTQIKVTTKTADVATFSNFMAPVVVIMAKEAIQQFDKFATPDRAIGTGPFVVDSMSDTGARMIKNQSYWEAGKPYLDEVDLVYLNDIEARYSAFTSGQVDFIDAIPGDHARSDENTKKYLLQWFPETGCTPFFPNCQKENLKDPRVFRALRLLIDHKEAADAAWGPIIGRTYQSSIFGAALSQWDFSQEEYSSFLEWKQPKDEAIRQALQMLDAAGYNKNNPLRGSLTSYTPTGGVATFNTEGQAIVQQQLIKNSQGAVQVPSLPQYDLLPLRDNLLKGNYDFAMSNEAPGFPLEPDAWFRFHYRSDGSLNFAHYNDPNLDQMIDKQRTIVNVEERKKYIKDILKYMIDNNPSSNVCGRYSANGAANKVKGWNPEAGSTIFGNQYKNIWLEA